MGLRHVGVGQETTWGTAVAPTKFYEALSEGVELVKERQEIEVIRGYSPRSIITLSQIVRGPVSVLANYHGLGLLLKHLLGSVTESTGATISTYTFPATTGIPSTDRTGLGLTFEMRRDGSLVWTYAGCKLTKWAQSFAVREISRVNFDIIGKSVTTSSSPTTASYDTLAPLKPSEVNVLFDGVTLSVTSAEVTVENPLDESYILGSTAIIEPDRSAMLKVGGTIDLYTTDFSRYNQFSADSVVDVTVKAVETTYSITYNMDKCLITSAPKVTGRERLKDSITWQSYYSATATENLQVVLVCNNTALV